MLERRSVTSTATPTTNFTWEVCSQGALFTHRFSGYVGSDIQQISHFLLDKSLFLCGQVQDMVSPQIPPLFLVKGAASFGWRLGLLRRLRQHFLVRKRTSYLSTGLHNKMPFSTLFWVTGHGGTQSA